MYKDIVIERFKVWSEFKEKLLTGAGTQIPETPLYHYTGAEGLLGIVRSGTVWATDSAYLNDASEFRYAVGLIKDVIQEAAADAEPDSWKYHCLNAIYVVTGDMESPASVGSAQVTDEQSFVVCFSEHGDGLSQWRGYGKSIGGYALGFSFEHLRAI
jgi:hypothetical protein